MGLVSPSLWSAQLASTVSQMPAHLATLVSTTRDESVFVTRVSDAVCERAVYCGGRVVLVGDALATFRPHFAVATEQAARHCLGLGRVWEGGMGLREWEGQVVGYGRRMWMASRVLGAWGLGGWWEFWGVLGRFVGVLLGGLFARRG